MPEITYVGEHLSYGIIGHILVVLSFVASLLASFSYLQDYSKGGDKGWQKTGAYSYIIHGISLLGIMAIILTIMANRYYEYEYVWAHVSDDLPMRYILSAFWEGQEGSFLLWAFWHVILGWIIMFRKNKWTSGVMFSLSLIQVFLTFMLLGVHVFGHKFGINPFNLLRDTMDIPLFANAEYVSMIEGNGLNPLLQNYWMTIHPPTLFLGFASASIPFCFAIAGMMKPELGKEWVKAVLPWALFSGGIFGTGILMGAAWAYEALSFGGYWAWDPVENASLAPWLIMLAGIHTNLIAKSTYRALNATFAFYLLSFILVLYSTFLTRSGILGDTSVHAFTEMGLEWQLVIFMAVFVLLGTYWYFKNRKKFIYQVEEEKINSREFWMFIGSLVLLFSTVLIMYTTSIPVYNKIFSFVGDLTGSDLSHLHRTAPIEPEAHYNRYQLWIAFFIGIISAVTIFLRYEAKAWSGMKSRLMTTMLLHIVIASIMSYIMSLWINLSSWTHILLLWSALFTISSNLDYLIRFLRGNLKSAASTCAHVGFGIMILGIMASGLNKKFISSNPFAQRGLIEGMDEERLTKNITLIKEEPMFMNDYWVTYVKDSLEGNIRKYTIHYRSVDSTDHGEPEQFVLYPQVVYDNKMTKVASVNPSTKHYLHKDIFTHIRSIPPQMMDVKLAHQIEDSLSFIDTTIRIGQTIIVQDDIQLSLNDIVLNPKHHDYTKEEGDLSIGLVMEAKHLPSEKTFEALPMIALRENLVYRYAHQVNPLKMRINVEEGAFDAFDANVDPESVSILNLKVNEEGTFEDYQIKLVAISDKINHRAYSHEEGDIAVTAKLEVTHPDGSKTGLDPVYIIRASRPYSLNDYDPLNGLDANLTHIDPTNGQLELSLTKRQSLRNSSVPIRFALDVPRTDYIVLEAIEFPGINLFWLGSCLMMFGLFLGMVVRRQKK